MQRTLIAISLSCVLAGTARAEWHPKERFAPRTFRPLSGVYLCLEDPKAVQKPRLAEIDDQGKQVHLLTAGQIIKRQRKLERALRLIQAAKSRGAGHNRAARRMELRLRNFVAARDACVAPKSSAEVTPAPAGTATPEQDSTPRPTPRTIPSGVPTIDVPNPISTRTPEPTIGAPSTPTRTALPSVTASTATPVVSPSPTVTRTPTHTSTPNASVTPRNPFNKFFKAGTNMTGLVDYDSLVQFVDQFKKTRGWLPAKAGVWEVDCRSATPDPMCYFDMDERGYIRSLKPGQIARTWNFAFPVGDEHAPDMFRRTLGRELVLIYEGQGTMEFAGIVGPEQSMAARPGVKTRTVTLPATGGVEFGIHILATNPQNYLRNFHLVPRDRGVCTNNQFKVCGAGLPSCAGGARCEMFLEEYMTPGFQEGAARNVFWPEMLESLQFYQTLRFMDWRSTNFSTEARWNQTINPDYFTYTVNKPTYARLTPNADRVGVPWSVIIDLANKLEADPWINVPHGAELTYTEELAKLFASRLDPKLKVKIEFSNEMWNGLFKPHIDYLNQLGAQYFTGTTVPQGEWRQRAYGRRAKEHFNAFLKYFPKDRTVRVMAGQSGNVIVLETSLKELTSADYDAIATAPYFGHNVGHANLNWTFAFNGQTVTKKTFQLTQDEFFAVIPQEMAVAQRCMDNDKALHLKLGKPLLAYEGGQHFWVVDTAGLTPAESQAFAKLLRDVQTDPRMYDLYLGYLNLYRERNGSLFCQFVDAGGGIWGAQKYYGQDLAGAPKKLAILKWIAQNS